MENRFIRAEEVADELGVSKPYAYKLIRQLNEELKDKGFITIAGRVNRQYFNERLYPVSLFSTRYRNPCSSNMVLTRYSPRPLPPVDLFRDFSTR